MINTLVIIGNGFDKWLGLDTGYGAFREFYIANRDSIMKKLHIKKIAVHRSDGQTNYISDVELIYGNPFEPKELDDIFWGNVETSMAEIDSEMINLFFGKSRRGLRKMGKSIVNAKRILREAFCQWVASIKTDVAGRGYSFGDNCLFINFNYTDTLNKAFRIANGSEYHIHGEAKGKNSIIFGHSDHPQEPDPMLYKLGGRFRGLFLIELLLRDTDKHAHENIKDLCSFLALRGAMDYEIKDVYILGFSMSPPDLEYVHFLLSATKLPTDMAGSDDEDEEVIDPLDELNQRIQFAVDRYGYGKSPEELTSEELKAADRQISKTLESYDKQYDKMFRKALKIRTDKLDGSEHNNLRKEDAKWHISYHEERSKKWYEAVMSGFGCTNYELFPSIEECIKPYKDS